MPVHTFHLTTLLQALEDDVYLAEALFYPEISRLGEEPDDLVLAVQDNAQRLLLKLQPGDLHRRRGPGGIVAQTLHVVLEPPARQIAWREPIDLTLPIVRWQHGESFLAYVPALGIEVVASTAEELDALLPRHVRIAILRRKANRLDELAWLARGQRLDVREVEITIDRPTPKQAAIAEREEEELQESVLDTVGTRLDWVQLVPAYEMEEPLALLAEVLTGRHPRSVLLIGPSGVGKTALVHELIRGRARLGLANRPFWATSGARLVAGQSGYGMWQQRCQKLCREVSKQQAILHLGNLMELLQVGKSEHQSQGLASFLRPWLARGELLAILECTPEQLPLIERQDPHLVRAFTPLRIKEPEGGKLESILRQFAAARQAAKLLPAGLVEVLRLHRRYAAYSANPGRPLRFLGNLLLDQPVDVAIDARTVTTAFSQETGLPLVLLEDSVRLDLAEANAWFGARVIGQTEAVSLVVDLLATVKAALNRPRKPIASLLFIGPTGVGKTEMAKALAEYLFGSRERLTRFDMSEYADAIAVQRLIGGLSGSEGILTAKVREQPFSVILLDEVEKAHPQLFDLLLQVLGEGRLTDAAGRLADFCNSVVILTSNLGAESYLHGDFGLKAGQPTAQRAKEHFSREVEKALRPEMFNRIDRIVPFAPLDEKVIQRIAERQIELLRERDGIRFRGVTLEVSDDLTAWLTKKGYDPRYGARPLKRTIERELLAPLSAQVNEYTTDLALRVSLGIENDRPRVLVRARTDAAGQAVAVGGVGQGDAEEAETVVELRRSLQKLSGCSAMLEVNNEIFRLERAKKKHHAYDPQLASLTQLRDDVQLALSEVIAREDEVLVRLHAQPAQVPAASASERPSPPRALAVAAGTLAVEEDRFDQLLLRLYLRRFAEPERISLVVFSEDQPMLFTLTEAYFTLLQSRGLRAHVWQWATHSDPERSPQGRKLVQPADAFADKTNVTVHVWDAKAKLFLADPVQVSATKGILGLGLEIHGEAVFPRFAAEEGLHHFQTAKQSSKLLVATGNCPMTELELPHGIDRKGAIGGQARRRLYRLENKFVEDARLGHLSLGDEDLEKVLRRCVDETMKRAAREVLES